ncbi:MAG: tyrosine--tRNA ligase [bacterium]|nr:tyrosine--tRNA ligase [bacterium]
MAKSSNKELIKELLERSVDKIYPSKEALEKLLGSGKRIRLYNGVDATGEHLHLGHLTNFLVLKRFRDLGHEVIFLIGDFTSRVGDPTDKLAVRKPLSEAEIRKNFKTFKVQAGKIVKFSGKNAAKVMFNSKWHKRMKFEDLLKLAGNFTVQQMIKRDMFQKRLSESKDINLVEFLYPLMQGYDSVALDVDLEVGGTDQTFNMLRGRDLMKAYRHKEKFVLTTKLLENPKTGKKLMNKSEGGLINLDDDPNDIFGKVMALPDEAILPVAEFSTEMPMDQVKSLFKMKPRDAKVKVAHFVVQTIYDSRAAKTAEERFDKLFSKKDINADELPEWKCKKSKLSLLDLLTSPQDASHSSLKSKTKWRILIGDGAIKLNGKTKSDPWEVVTVRDGDILKNSAKDYFRIKIG